ncbi:MAG: hypothetical protein LBH42_08815 [Treponema sp.]|jgi:hypothetical protein|nr:hypothetical protein [Treponema sp.]
MGVSEKASKISPIVAAVCIIVYAAAIAFGAVRIISSIGERRNLAEKEFYDLTDRASSSAVFLGFMSEAYQETIKDFIGTSRALLGIIITGSDGEYAFERYPGSGIVWAGNSPRFKIGAGIPSEPFYMPLRIEGQRNVTIQAVYGYIDYYLLQKVLRSSLLAVLSALVLAFLTLLVEFGFKNKAYYKTTTDELKPARKPKEGPAGKGKNPQGLYSPKGNIGWESYTRDRLASELHRCSSFEQDLTFLIMEFRESIPVFRQFAEETVAFFTMRDLVFEKGEKGISVILPSMDLEQGIIKAEEFRSRIIAKLPESFDGRTGLCVGLSSRTGRLVEADRLILEASSALQRALADKSSHVIAFKSDPEKYREFIRQNGRKA